MQEFHGQLTGRPIAIFGQRALEYVSDPHARCWIHVPHIIEIRDPDDEKFLREALDGMKNAKTLHDVFEYAACRNDMRAHYKNLLIELRERIPEVIDALRAARHCVVPNTVMRLGLHDFAYMLGVQIAPADIAALRRNPDFRNCVFRPAEITDLEKILRGKTLMPMPAAA